MARIVDFADGAQSETTPTIGNISASDLVKYADDASYESDNVGSPIQGNIYFNTTSGLPRYHNGTAWINLADVATIQSFTNKSIDNDLNDVTNIDNDAVKVGASIDATKIHDGSVDNAEYGYLNGVTSGIQGQLDNKQNTSEKGAANGYASLDGSGLVPASQLPSFVDDVLEYANFASLPVTGETGKIYITTDDNKQYRWTGSVYAQISANIDQLNDLTDVNAPSPADGEALIYNNGSGFWEPGEVQNVIQENITLIGKGTAQWNTSVVGPQTVGSQLTETNDFAFQNNIKTGFTFTPDKTGDLTTVTLGIVDRGLGNGDGNLRLFVYATSAGAPTGASLQQSSSNPATTNYTGIPNTVVFENFNFGSTLQLIGGTEYFFALESTDTGTLYMRRSTVNETNSANYTEDSADAETFSLSPTQETLYHNVLFSNLPGELVLDTDCFISVPPLADDRHTIQAQTISIDDGQCAYITLDRSAVATTNRTVTVDDITNVTPDNDKLIFARAVGTDCYVGIHDPQRISDGDTVTLQKDDVGTVFTPTVAIVEGTAGGIVSNATWTDVVFNSVTSDVDSIYNSGTGEFTIPEDGIYNINATIGITQFPTGFMEAAILKNASFHRFGPNIMGVGGAFANMTRVEHTEVLSAGDVIKFQIWHNSGSNENLQSQVTLNYASVTQVK